LLCEARITTPYKEGDVHINVRLADENDVAAVIVLQRQWTEEEITYGYQPSTQEQIRSALGPYFFVAETRGEVIGFVSGSVSISPGLAVMPEGQSYLSLDDLYIIPEWRSKGIGHLLVDTIIASAQQAGLQAAMVYSSTKDVHRVLRFYEQNGFQSWFVQLFRRL
jgi:ribosomal protein S18 acetylase RimI-like enzyme